MLENERRRNEFAVRPDFSPRRQSHDAILIVNRAMVTIDSHAVNLRIHQDRFE